MTDIEKADIEKEQAPSPLPPTRKCNPKFFCIELSPHFDWFGLTDANGKEIDLRRSFCATRHWITVFIRLCFLGLAMSDMAVGFHQTQHKGFFMAYLSNWSLTYASLYLLLSFAITICENSSRLIFNLTWGLFSIATVHEIAVIILFWTQEYNPRTYKIDYYIIMTHGIVGFVVLVEGLIINRVPVRLKHCFLVLAFAVLFVVWDLLQNLVFHVNPYHDDDDDALYDSLRWQKDPKAAGILTAIVLVVVIPVVQIVVWLLSFWNRRYI